MDFQPLTPEFPIRATSLAAAACPRLPLPLRGRAGEGGSGCSAAPTAGGEFSRARPPLSRACRGEGLGAVQHPPGLYQFPARVSVVPDLEPDFLQEARELPLACPEKVVDSNFGPGTPDNARHIDQ